MQFIRTTSAAIRHFIEGFYKIPCDYCDDRTTLVLVKDDHSRICMSCLAKEDARTT